MSRTVMYFSAARAMHWVGRFNLKPCLVLRFGACRRTIDSVAQRHGKKRSKPVNQTRQGAHGLETNSQYGAETTGLELAMGYEWAIDGPRKNEIKSADYQPKLTRLV